MASSIVVRALEKGKRATDSLVRFREKAKIRNERVYGVVEGALGGLAGGFVDGKWGGDDGFHNVGPVPTVLVTGAVLAVAGASEFVPMHFAEIGKGALSYALGDLIRRHVKA